MTSAPICNACRAPKAKFRCSQCRKVWYCSRTCQKADWSSTTNNVNETQSGGHRRECRAFQAQQELFAKVLPSMSLETASRGYYTAVDEVKKETQQRRVGPSIDELAQLQFEDTSIGSMDVSADDQQNTPGNHRMNVIPPTSKEKTTAWVPPPKSVDRRNPQKAKLSFLPRNIDVIPNTRCQQRDEEPVTISQNITRENTSQRTALDVCLQHMGHLSCYQLLLRTPLSENDGEPIIGQDLNLDSLNIRQAYNESPLHQSTTTTLKLIDTARPKDDQDLLCIRLPGKITNVRAYPVMEKGCSGVSIRLMYEHGSRGWDEHETMNDYSIVGSSSKCLLTPASLPTLTCRSCHHNLLSVDDVSSLSVDRVLPLPSGHWDDMADYLTCFPGEPVMDIGNVTGAVTSMSEYGSSVCLEDNIAIIIPNAHVLNLCVLATTGYGEEEEDVEMTVSATDDDNKITSVDDDKDPTALVRGLRSWRDLVGGATSTCGVCAAVLGFAQPDGSHRLLKHRIVWNKNAQRVSDEQPSGPENPPCWYSTSITDFVTYEMVRYAESKAIFAFQIIPEGFGGTCLWLRLVNWDTQAATNNDIVVETGSEISKVEWRHLIQILFEETPFSPQSSSSDASSMVPWFWDNDVCCLPPVKQNEEKVKDSVISETTPPPSAVRLCISNEEFEELCLTLNKSSDFYSDDVKLATIQAKTGQRPSPDTESLIGLAAILV